MNQVIDDPPRCDACGQPRIAGITHHLSRCPYNPINRREQIQKEKRKEFWTGLRLWGWFNLHEDTIMIGFFILFVISLAIFAIFSPE